MTGGAAEWYSDGQWSAASVAQPAGALSLNAEGADCPTLTACVLVGASAPTDGVLSPLAESWNGTRWQIASLPSLPANLSGGLVSVSCPTAGTCTAVGSTATEGTTAAFTPLVEQLRDGVWSSVPAPVVPGSTSSFFTSVSCPSAAACTAVGESQTIAVSGLSNVSNVSFIEDWDGSSWQLEAPAMPAGTTASYLHGVSCSGVGTCTAVGQLVVNGGNFQGLVETSVDGTWTPSAMATELYAVSCFSSSACMALGSGSGAPAEYWNGTAWVSMHMPIPPDADGYSSKAVSCGGPQTCVAMGFTTLNGSGPSSSSEGVADVWSGGTWSVVPLEPPPAPTGAGEYYLALGDSVPVWTGVQSYPYLIDGYERQHIPGLQVENLARSGDTTSDMRDDGQYQEALAFLRAHRGHIAFITIDIGGNDLVNCVAARASIDSACFKQDEQTMVANLSFMLRNLRDAAPGVPLVGMTYFDPFLGEWLAGGAVRQWALETVQELLSVNGLLTSLYGARDTANVQGAFGSTDLTKMVSSPWGQVPVAVNRACAWLDITCQQGQGEGANSGDDPDVAGEAVIARTFEKIMSSMTIPPAPPRLLPGQSLRPDRSLTAGPYRLIMQGDGNLVEYQGSKALWASGTAGHPGTGVVMQKNGNLVEYYRGKAIWASRTRGHPGARLALQGSDGNVVIYTPANKPIWAAGT